VGQNATSATRNKPAKYGALREKFIERGITRIGLLLRELSYHRAQQEAFKSRPQQG
jgi:hypothetical protein